VARLLQQDRANADIVLAWRIEEMRVRTRIHKRLPDVRSLLIGYAPPRQSVEEQRRIMHQLAEHYGLQLTTQKKDMH